MGHAFEFGMGTEVDLAQTTACLTSLVERGCAPRVRAITNDGVLEVTRENGVVVARVLPAQEAAPILAACAAHTGDLDYEHALRLDDGLQDLHVHGYDGEPFTLPSLEEGARGLVVGGVVPLQGEVRDAIEHERASMEDEPECREESAEAIAGLQRLDAALALCARFELILRTWE